MWLTLLIAAVTVAVSRSQGPDFSVGLLSCVNQNETTNTSMVIDCAGHNVDPGNLTREIDLLLSDDELRGRLTSLNISHTPLTQLPMSVCRLSNLVVLKLDHNRLTPKLPDNCLTNMTNLQILSANYNNITALQNGLFDGLWNLRGIYLNWNQISSIGPRVFTEEAGLINLTMVSLSRNLLTTLEPWPIILGFQRPEHRPVIVMLRNNRIASLTKRIGWHYNCNMSQTHFRIDFKHNLLTHVTDMTSGWGLTSNELFCLIRFPGGHPLSRISFQYNPFICDCQDFRFYAMASQFVYSNIFQRVYCDNPPELFGMEIARIQLIEFICELDDGCPSGCKCSFRPANATVHVDCRSNNFSSLPLRLPPLPKSYAKYKLDFSNNKLLQRVDHRPYLVNTSFIDVSHCAVKEITFEAWRALVNIATVFLNDNFLTKVPRKYSEIKITSKSISLYENLWDCSCDRSWMHDWFNSDSAHFSDPSGVLCQTPERLRGMSIMMMNKEDFCVDRVQRAVTTSLLAVFGSVALLIILCVGVYCLRSWLHRCWNWHPFDRDECIGEDMDYDVFLSCSSEDHDTHGRRLQDLIESKGYRVFRPEVHVTDEATAAVQRSRRTVCLLSKHFIKRSARFRSNVV